MAARKVNTPGATKPEEVKTEAAQPTTAEQAEAALEHITGNDPEPEAPQDQSTNETSSLGALVEDERLDQILEGQKRIEKKLDALLKAGKVEAPKKLRWQQGKHGLELKEA
ncbi:hypothetical protein [Acinetobacter sp. UBA2581]|uniref:hypothetical protein n=1 Tax=Acinetobacter sp. UBA2581 TaxID=1945932 RepID=UPI00257D37C3|nr:hypothetical protein [Acinetobacter sp. UBA2581]